MRNWLQKVTRWDLLYQMECEDSKYHEEERLKMLALQEGETDE